MTSTPEASTFVAKPKIHDTERDAKYAGMSDESYFALVE
jgi:hypothetical protein